LPIRALRFGAAPTSSWEFRLGGPGIYTHRVFFDPFLARILGFRRRDGTPIGFLRKLHIRWLAGAAGYAWNGYGALVAVVLVISGLVVWFPIRRSQWSVRLAVRRDRGRKRFLFDLHNTIGYASAALLLLLLITGATFPFRPVVKEALYGWSNARPEPQFRLRVSPGTLQLPYELLLGRATQAAPEGKAIALTLPQKADEPVVIRKELREGRRWGNHLLVTLNPYTGQVLHLQDTRRSAFGPRLVAMLLSLHAGYWGAPVLQWVYIPLGLAPAALLVTGLMKWSAHRRSRRTLAGQPSVPERPGRQVGPRGRSPGAVPCPDRSPGQGAPSPPPGTGSESGKGRD